MLLNSDLARYVQQMACLNAKVIIDVYKRNYLNNLNKMQFAS